MSKENAETQEWQGKGYSMPTGYGSILNHLENSFVTASMAMLYLAIFYLSVWKSDKSFDLSIARLADIIGISPSYVSKLINKLTGWIDKFKRGRKGTIYTITKHKDVAEGEERGTIWMPHGLGSPIEAMFRGVISWKACLVWMMLKKKSDWKTGLTFPTNMLYLAKVCRLGPQTVIECIKELTTEKFIERTTAMNEHAIYQLYPKPKCKDKEKSCEDAPDKYTENFEKNRTKTHLMSNNWQYRIELHTGNIEKRVGRRKWKRISDYERTHSVPKAIINDFEHYLTMLSLRAHPKS